VFAIKGFGKEAGSGSLTDPAWAGEQEGMGNAAAANSIAQSAGHMFLAHNFVESLWSPFSGENKVAHFSFFLRLELTTTGDS
jgi:hypothetical protein